MLEFSKINWRGNPLEEDVNFLSANVIAETHVLQYVSGKFDPRSVPKVNLPKKEDDDDVTIPGYEYYFKKQRVSCLNREEHARIIITLKNFESGKTKLDLQDRASLEYYNSVKTKIQEENVIFQQFVENEWKKNSKFIEIKKHIYDYAKELRLKKLQHVFTYPQYYKPLDSLPFTSSADDLPVEMIHVANLLEVGKVAKYNPNPLFERYYLKKETRTGLEQRYTSNLSVLLDAHVQELLQWHSVDVAISMSALKVLVNYATPNQQWHIPFTIKFVTKSDGSAQKVVFFDKPLVRMQENKGDLLDKCCKRMLKSNFCCCDGLTYERTNTSISECSNDAHLYNNATYKLWTIQQKQQTNDTMCNVMMKHQPTTMLPIRVMIRCKIDACEQIAGGGLQAVSVTPKVEYQPEYGAEICTRAELAKQWATTFFRPCSTLYRVRVHPFTHEVFKFEQCSTQKIVNEATSHHQFKPHLAVGILYKLFNYVKRLSPGEYMLRHEPKQGPFYTLLRQCDKEDVDAYDLHCTYARDAKIIEQTVRPWTPIDTHLIMPAFEGMQHMPGMFHPAPMKRGNKFGLITHKNEKKKGKKKKLKK